MPQLGLLGDIYFRAPFIVHYADIYIELFDNQRLSPRLPSSIVHKPQGSKYNKYCRIYEIVSNIHIIIK